VTTGGVLVAKGFFSGFLSNWWHASKVDN